MQRTATVAVPGGIADGQRISLRGQGGAGAPGAPPGDLYVSVGVRPDERFERDGDDVVSVVDLPFTQAALGTQMTVPTLDGEERVELPAGTQPGDVIVLRGKGVGRLRGRGRGDHRIHVNVLVPRRLTDEQRRQLEAFEQGAGPDTYAGDGSLLGRIRAAFR
jgi:molecular chaperone DnaJ